MCSDGCVEEESAPTVNEQPASTVTTQQQASPSYPLDEVPEGAQDLVGQAEPSTENSATLQQQSSFTDVAGDPPQSVGDTVGQTTHTVVTSQQQTPSESSLTRVVAGSTQQTISSTGSGSLLGSVATGAASILGSPTFPSAAVDPTQQGVSSDGSGSLLEGLTTMAGSIASSIVESIPPTVETSPTQIASSNGMISTFGTSAESSGANVVTQLQSSSVGSSDGSPIVVDVPSSSSAISEAAEQSFSSSEVLDGVISTPIAITTLPPTMTSAIQQTTSLADFGGEAGQTMPTLGAVPASPVATSLEEALTGVISTLGAVPVGPSITQSSSGGQLGNGAGNSGQPDDNLGGTVEQFTGSSGTGSSDGNADASLLSGLSNIVDQVAGVNPSAAADLTDAVLSALPVDDSAVASILSQPAEQVSSIAAGVLTSVIPAVASSLGQTVDQSLPANPADVTDTLNNVIDQGTAVIDQITDAMGDTIDPALQGVLDQVARIVNGAANQLNEPLCAVTEIVNGVSKQLVKTCSSVGDGDTTPANEVASTFVHSGGTPTSGITQVASVASTEAPTLSQSQLVSSATPSSGGNDSSQNSGSEGQNQSSSNDQSTSPESGSSSEGSGGQSSGSEGQNSGSSQGSEGQSSGNQSHNSGSSPQSNGGQNSGSQAPSNSGETDGNGTPASPTTSSNVGSAPANCPKAASLPCPSCPSEDGSRGQISDPSLGPCPGRGFQCAECPEGWFCPPRETPAQAAPCGMGWPCYDCSSGWFCDVNTELTPKPISEPAPAPASSLYPTITAVNASPSPPVQGSTGEGSVPSIPANSGGESSSLNPDWSSLGCFQDGISRTLLGGRPTDYVRGDVSGNTCVSHCSSKGYSFAGTENGQECWCGRGIRDDAVRLPETYCGIPCQGTREGLCGGSWTISVFYRDGDNNSNEQNPLASYGSSARVVARGSWTDNSDIGQTWQRKWHGSASMEARPEHEH